MGNDRNGSLTQWVGTTVPLTTAAMAVAAVYAAAISISANIIVAMFTSSTSSGSGSYGALNQIQLVILLPMLQTYMPNKLYDYLKSMKAGLFNADFFYQQEIQAHLQTSRTCLIFHKLMHIWSCSAWHLEAHLSTY